VSDASQQLIIDYIVKEIIRRPEFAITEDTPLVSSGLIDSLALVDILARLEDVTRMRIPAARSMRRIWITFETCSRRRCVLANQKKLISEPAKMAPRANQFGRIFDCLNSDESL
jgi:acyl carrier protein